MERYKLCGYINLFGIIPDFVYPVYYRNGKYFFAHGDKFCIKRFFRVKKDYLREIQPLPEKYGLIQRQVENDQIYIYEKSYGEILLGTGYNLVKKISNIRIGNTILQNILEEFREDFAEDSGKKVLAADVKYYATGRRKTAVARVYLADGNGKIIVNQKPIESYFSGGYYREKVLMPLELTGTYGAVDVYATVKGGGVTGQAEAIRHGISRALINIAIDSKKMLKDEGSLTRDPRMKERKKSGLKGARRKPQRSKR